MAIVINDHPGDYYSAHGDLLFVVYEATKSNDETNYPNYKYVADVYVDGTLAARIKKWPQPDSKRGIFNIGPVVRSYLANVFSPATTFLAQSIGEDEFFAKVTVKFGEEYDDTLYTNLTIDQDRFYFNHYNGRLIGTRTALSAKLGLGLTNRPLNNYVTLASGKSFIPFFPNATSTPIEIKTYNHVNALVETKNTSYVPTNGKATVTISYQLSQLNGVDVDLFIYVNGVETLLVFIDTVATFDVTEGDTVLAKMITEGDAQPWPGTGTPWANMYITEDSVTIYNQITTDQGTPDQHVLYETSFVVQDRDYFIGAFADNTTVPTTDIVDNTTTDYFVPYKIQLFDASPTPINLLYPGLITDYIKYYTVQIGSTSIYRFDLVCEPRYDTYTLHFLNQYGGYESRLFSKISRKRIEVSKKSFGKLPYTISDAGLIQYRNSNNVYNEQRSIYFSQFTEPWTLNTDILSDEEYTWLQDLIVSPEVYLEQDGYFIPVTIQSNNYEKRKQINDKLTNLTLEIEFGENYTAQVR